MTEIASDIAVQQSANPKILGSLARTGFEMGDLMHRTIEQRRFARQLATLNGGDLFEQMRVLRRELRPTDRYHQSPHDTHLWKSLAVEAEIIRRHPNEMLAPFRAWLVRRDSQL